VSHGETLEAATTVTLTDLRMGLQLQVRAKHHAKIADDYARQMLAGAQFPAVLVARLDGILHLVDGYHRAAATVRAGRRTIQARIVDVKDEATIWRMAAEANLQHGIALTTAEKRNAVRAFIRGDGHKRAGGSKNNKRRLLSTREIAAALHHAVTHHTVNNILRKEFPAVHAAMKASAGKDDLDDPTAKWPRLPEDYERLLRPDQQVVERGTELAQLIVKHVEIVKDEPLLARLGRECGRAMDAVRNQRLAVTANPGAKPARLPGDPEPPL
jgi:hypothetical protein